MGNNYYSPKPINVGGTVRPFGQTVRRNVLVGAKKSESVSVSLDVNENTGKYQVAATFSGLLLIPT